MLGKFVREWIYIYKWLSHFAANLKLSQQMLIGYIPIQNKVFFKSNNVYRLILIVLWERIRSR